METIWKLVSVCLLTLELENIFQFIYNKNISKETNLIQSKNTSIRRPCNTLSGITIDRFIPQIPQLKKNIQNPMHLIQEVNNTNWVRGGQPSRQYIKNKEYLNKCLN